MGVPAANNNTLFRLAGKGLGAETATKMFKKDRDLAERSRSLLKNKETKKLKEVFLTKFPRLKEAELDALIGKEQFTRIYLATKTIVYSVGDVPYFIDVEGRNNIVPTVQLLWRLPHILRTFVIHAPVSEFVMNGADLMLPGLASVDGLEGVMRDEKMSIRVVGNPLPFAVGISNCSWEGILTNGRKGKALCVTSVYGDCLCPLKAAPKSGFGGSSIYALEGYQEVTENSDDDDDEEEGGVSYKKALKNKGGSGGSRIGGCSGIISKGGVLMPVSPAAAADSDADTIAIAPTASKTTAATVATVVLPTDLGDWDHQEDQEEYVMVAGNEVDVESEGTDKDEDKDQGSDGGDEGDDGGDEKEVDENDNDSDNDQAENENEEEEEEGIVTTASTPVNPLQAMQAMDGLMLTALLRAIKYVIKVSDSDPFTVVLVQSLYTVNPPNPSPQRSPNTVIPLVI